MMKLNNDRLASYFKSLYEDSPFFVTYKTPNLEFIYCNKVMREFVGYKSIDQLLGKNDYDLCWEKFADLYKRHETDALNNNRYVVILPTSDINDHEALVTCYRTPFLDSDNKAIGVLTHAYILHDKRSLELSNMLEQTEPAREQRSYFVNKKTGTIPLTTKERECLFYFIRGKSCKMIGKILGVSHRTIETHIDHIKAKFNCTLKSDLMDAAIEMGYLYDLPPTLLNR